MVFVGVLDACGCHPSLSIQRHECNDCIWFAQSAGIITFNVSYQFFCFFGLFLFLLFAVFWQIHLQFDGLFESQRIVSVGKMQFVHQILFWLQNVNGFIWLFEGLIAAGKVRRLLQWKSIKFMYWMPYFQKDNRRCMQRPFLLSSRWYITIVLIMLIDE